MFEKIIKKYEWISIPIGLIALTLGLCGVDCKILTIVAGFLCALYIGYIVYLITCMPTFDWHLINGNFLGKVIAFVILIPSLIVCFFYLNRDYSPQNLVDDNRYYPSCIDKTSEEAPSIYWTVYYHFIDPGNQHMTASHSGRGLAAVVAILGVFLLNGLLVSSIIEWIDRRKEKWMKGEVRYNRFMQKNRHYVIIGGNDMVAGIVKQLVKLDNYILIQTSSDVESFRRELFSTLTEEEQKSIIIYYGNRTSETDIEHLGLCQAEEIYILGEETRNDDVESYHDTMNMECLDLIYNNFKKSSIGIEITQLLERKKNVCDETEKSVDEQQKIILNSTKEGIEKDLKQRLLNCRVMFEYQTTFSVFQFYDLDKEISAYINFKPFNYYEMWAQKIFINKEINSEKIKENSNNRGYLPLEGYNGIKEKSNTYVHLFIVGMSRIGCAMAIEAAHLSHYPNYKEDKKIRTKITFIDKNAKAEKDFFVGRFKELFSLSHYRYGSVENNVQLLWQDSHMPSANDYLGGDFIDIEWEFINGGIEQTAVQDYILNTSKKDARITIAICLPESNRSHASALYLNKEIYKSDSVQQVLVYNRYGNSIISALHSKDAKHPYLNKLKSFGSPADCLSIDWLKQSEEIGNAIGDRYEQIKKMYIDEAMKEAGQEDNKSVKYKGKSQVANYFSNIYNGNMIWTKLRSIDYNGCYLSPDQITLLSDVEHNRWNIEQLLMNFRPLTQKEQNDIIAKQKDKEVLKGQMAHLNICSNKRLLELRCVDVAARAYDEGLTTLLHDIYTKLSQKQ